MLKWTIVVMIGLLALMLNFGSLPASDNAQDNPNVIKKSSHQSESSKNGVIAKTKNALNSVAHKTERVVRKAANKTGNFFKRVGNKTRKWFKGQ